MLRDALCDADHKVQLSGNSLQDSRSSKGRGHINHARMAASGFFCFLKGRC